MIHMQPDVLTFSCPHAPCIWYACAGKIVEVQRQTTEGFAKGSFEVEGLDAHQGLAMQVEFQNENLIALMGGNVVACVPDLICCLEAEGRSLLIADLIEAHLTVLWACCTSCCMSHCVRPSRASSMRGT